MGKNEAEVLKAGSRSEEILNVVRFELKTADGASGVPKMSQGDECTGTSF